MQIANTFDFLLGSWRVERVLLDNRESIRGVFTGTAVLSEVAQEESFTGARRARSRETGELNLGRHLGEAHRSLEYELRDDTNVSLYFADGRPFVDLQLGSGAWQARHLCGDDCYLIATFVRSSMVIEEYWRVRGPKTDYDAVTRFERMINVDPNGLG